MKGAGIRDGATLDAPSMLAARQIPQSAPASAGDQRIVMHGVDWKTYVLLREALDIPGLRMTYFNGALELMSPSPEHERIKKVIARLVEAYANDCDVPLYGYGSTTFRRELKARGLEPDECYCVGADLAQFPDIAIEVTLTSGGIEKLPVYEGLEVAEVWFWADDADAFQLYALGASGYEPIARSKLVPGLDFELLGRFATRKDQPQAIKEFREAVRASR